MGKQIAENHIALLLIDDIRLLNLKKFQRINLKSQ